MSAKRKICCTLIAVIALLGLCCIDAGAYSAESDVETGVHTDMTDIADGIGDGASSLLGESLEEDGQQLIEALEPQRLLEMVTDVFLLGVPDAIKLFCLVTGLVIVSSVCERVCGSIGNGALSESVESCSAIAIMALILGIQINHIVTIEKYFEDLGHILGCDVGHRTALCIISVCYLEVDALAAKCRETLKLRI